MITQCHMNHGRLGGWLVSVLCEFMPGNWELYFSFRIVEPSKK